MASSLPVLDESGAFERPDHLARSQGREFGHESSGNRYRNADPSLERRPFLRDRFPVIRQAFQVQRDSFLDVALGFFQCFTLGVTTRQSRDGRYVATFSSLLVKDRISEHSSSLACHH